MLAWALATTAPIRLDLGIGIDDVDARAAEGVTIARRLGSALVLAMCLFMQASVSRSDLARSLALLNEALTFARLSPTRWYEMMVRGHRARVAFECGEANVLQEFLPVLRDLQRGGARSHLPMWLWQIVPMLQQTGLAEDAAELVGALESGTIADVQVLPFLANSSAVRAELGDDVFARAQARGAARSYQEVMERVFTLIERDQVT